MVELFWWGYLLVKLQPERTTMILGEGSIFLFILVVGAYVMITSHKRELKLSEQKRNFLLSVTHELKSPLASIKLTIQTILKRNLEEQKRNEFLSNSLKDIERLDDLVENMLLATKIENSSYTYPMEEFDFSDLTSKIASRLQVHACGNERLIYTDVQPGIKIKGDSFALASVVTNLIENGIKYSTPCSTLTVKLSQVQHKVILTVTDQGIGIADIEKGKIFNKFYRVGSENTRKTKGTGIGLFIVKNVVEKHKGQIFVRDNQPKGTVFEVVFNS